MTTMAKTMITENDDNKVDGDGATGHYNGAGVTGDDNDNDNDGNNDDDGDGVMGDGARGYDYDEDGNGRRRVQR